MDGEGYIRLYWKTKRSLVGDNPVALGLWAHILLSCAVKKKLLHNGEILEPGECIISLARLANAEGVSRKQLDRIVRSLESDGMILVTKRDRNGTKLSVCNFRTYQPQFFDAGTETQRNGNETETKRKRNGTQTENPKNPKSPKVRRFTPPTVEEVREYCEERGNGIDPQRFVDHYAAAGWKRGKGTPIKDWKACVRTWEGNQENSKKKSGKMSPAEAGEEYLRMRSQLHGNA